MKIAEIFPRDHVVPDLKGTDKQAILREMCEHLSQLGLVGETEKLFDTLMEREKLGSTGIGENVAVPHAKSDSTDRLLCLFGRSIAGVEFESLDKRPVNFVCLLIAPPHSTGQHLKALARISRLLKNQDLRAKILQANNANEIYSALIDEDSNFI